jgi:hypothetical protein
MHDFRRVALRGLRSVSKTMDSPSQYGQDLFVLEALGGRRGGYFLDFGASNGVRFSNTLLLEQSFGWRGICIEPNDSFFSELKKKSQMPLLELLHLRSRRRRGVCRRRFGFGRRSG